MHAHCGVLNGFWVKVTVQTAWWDKPPSANIWCSLLKCLQLKCILWSFCSRLVVKQNTVSLRHPFYNHSVCCPSYQLNDNWVKLDNEIHGIHNWWLSTTTAIQLFYGSLDFVRDWWLANDYPTHLSLSVSSEYYELCYCYSVWYMCLCCVTEITGTRFGAGMGWWHWPL